MWKTAKLGALCEVVTKGTTPTSVGFKFEQNGINFVKVESIALNGTFIHRKFASINEECNEALKRSQLKEGDVLFSIAGALGRTAVVTSDILPANTNQALAILRLKKDVEVDRQFLLYMLSSDSIKKQSDANKGGVAQQNLSLTQLKSYELSLPPLAEQQRIVEKLDAAFAEIDTAKNSHRLKSQECEKLVSITISKILENFQGQKPTRDVLGEVAYTSGRIGWKGLTKKEYVEQGYLFLSVHGLNYGKFVNFRDAFRITKERFEESPEIMLKEGDILLCKDGAGIGKLGIISELKEPATINSSLLLIRPNEILSSEYVYYYLLAPEFQSIIQTKIDGATTPHLYQRDIRQLPIIFPEKRVQEQAVSEIRAALEQVEVIHRANTKNVTNYAALKSAILAQELQSEAA